MNPRIVCAANRYPDGTMLIGARHWDSHMHKQAELLRECGKNTRQEHDQGFIDQFGTFYTRTAAWKIASYNGQILRRCGGDESNGGTLYSENLC